VVTGGACQASHGDPRAAVTVTWGALALESSPSGRRRWRRISLAANMAVPATDRTHG